MNEAQHQQVKERVSITVKLYVNPVCTVCVTGSALERNYSFRRDLMCYPIGNQIITLTTIDSVVQNNQSSKIQNLLRKVVPPSGESRQIDSFFEEFS